jgi:ribosomal protein S18 acetylase RimI-like enzyme
VISIRDMDRRRDQAAVEAIDTSFETDTVYDVVLGSRRIDLVERRLAAPRVKVYSMAEAFADWSTWDTGWVAEDGGVVGGGGGGVCGFAAVEYESWHARLVLWHLYVAAAQRRRGIARALLAHVEAHGRALGAAHVWLETTSVNVPGIAAYERLGYALCGADATLYHGLPYEDEAALYFTKPLG